MKISDYTRRLLNDIEERIDVEVEEDFLNQWRKFYNGQCKDEIFYPRRKKVSKPKMDILGVNINDAINDHDLMLQYEFNNVSLNLGTPYNVLCVRANYGTGILSSLFGAEVFVMPYEMKTLPTTRAINDTMKIREIVEKGVPDLKSGFGHKVFEMGEVYKEVMKDYPKISKYVHVYHPDLQGPLDICELLWGGGMFYAMYDDEELVHDMLSLITDTYIRFMDKWFEMYHYEDNINAHWTCMFKGKVLLRNDSAMNISGEFYKEFAMPYDAKILEYYDGGIVHFCGKGVHYIEYMSTIPKLYGINLSQPHYNDMEKIYKNTVDKGLFIIELKRSTAEADVKREGGFKGLVQTKEIPGW